MADLVSCSELVLWEIQWTVANVYAGARHYWLTAVGHGKQMTLEESARTVLKLGIARMDDVIENAFAVGRRDWPDLDRPQLADYARHVGELRTSAEDLKRYGSDLYLALGCAMGDTRALRALQDRHFAVLRGVLVKSHFDQTQIQDVLQQIMLRLCAGTTPQMLSYAGRASLTTWLCVATLRLALDIWPRSGPDELPLALEHLADKRHTPELEVAIENARPAFQAALQSSVLALPDRDKTLLRCSFLDGLTIDEIGNLYGVHRATAARWISEIRRKLLDDVRLKLSQELGLSLSEFESIALLIRSQLHLSLSRVFGAT